LWWEDSWEVLNRVEEPEKRGKASKSDAATIGGELKMPVFGILGTALDCLRTHGPVSGGGIQDKRGDIWEGQVQKREGRGGRSSKLTICPRTSKKGTSLECLVGGEFCELLGGEKTKSPRRAAQPKQNWKKKKKRCRSWRRDCRLKNKINLGEPEGDRR